MHAQMIKLIAAGLSLAAAASTSGPLFPADDPAKIAARAADERAQERATAFERTLWADTPPGQGRRHRQRPVAEQRPLVEAFFATLETPAEKAAFIHVGSSRYVYAIDRELFGEYAVKLLKDQDAAVRGDAVRGLTYKDLRRHAAAVEPLLDDPDAEVRALAVAALGRFARHDRLPRMAAMAGAAAESEGLRVSAIAAIGALARDKAATAEQREREFATLRPHLAADAAPNVQQAALNAIAPSAATPQAAPHVDAVRGLATSTDPRVRETAVAALTLFAGDAATAAIRAALTDGTPEVRRAAARAAGARKDAGASAAIVKLLGDGLPWVRIEAVGALAAIGDVAPAGAIAALLRDPSEYVRRAAVEALETLKASAFAKDVAAALADPVQTVRYQAVRALARIGTKEQAAAVAAVASDPDYPTRAWAMRALDAFDARDHRATIERLTHDPERELAAEAKMLLEKWDRK